MTLIMNILFVWSIVLHMANGSSMLSTKSFDVRIGNEINDIKILTTEKTKSPKRWRRNYKIDLQINESQSIDDADSAVESFHYVGPTHSTRFVAECNMPTDLGNYIMRSYHFDSSNQHLEPIVVMYGDVKNKNDVLVRVHDQCFTSEVFGSMRCDCREQLKESLKLIKKYGGIVIYLQQEGRGIGAANKIAAYALQDRGYDTVDANHQLGFKEEMREYLAVPDILSDLGISSIKLMTNNPFKIEQLQSLGVVITQRIPIQIKANFYNKRYLNSKKNRMQHMLSDMDTNQEQDDSLQSVEEKSDSASTQETDINVDNKQLLENAIQPTNFVKNTNTSYIFGRESVEKVIEEIKLGKPVIVVDDANRENEGDLIVAAELATDETVGFIVRHSSGVLCVSLESDRLDELQLPPMVVNNEDPKQTAYTISVDYKHNTTTGISAADRAATFRALANPKTTPTDFQRPGHVFPLRYKKGGVLSRAGHTEASLDLTRLAGLHPCGVLAEIVHDDGSLKRLPELEIMAKEFNLSFTSVQDIIAYRIETNS